MTGGAGQRSGRIAFEPGLEGLRGLALLGMLCFHSRFEWAAGGFLPLATFFTLSGYLITSLFLAEWESEGRIQLRRFWSRRFRRLMPAALLTLTCVPLIALVLGTPDQLERLQDDVLYALFYVANWHFWYTDAAYQELFSSPSPLIHFWSLSIEEQFYLAFPLVTAAGLAIGRGSRSVFAGILLTLSVLGVGVSIALIDAGASIDRVYYGSDTRAPELLMGGLLALALHGRTIGSAGVQRGIQWLGAAGLVFMLWLWSRVQISDLWIYQGGLAAYTLVTLVVIAGAVQPAGVVRWFLSLRVLQWVGRVSYGGYLFHWPIFVWLSPERTGLDGLALFALRVPLALGLADLSYRFLEEPIRRGRALRGWRPWVATPVAFAGVALLAVSVRPTPTDTYAYRDFNPETAHLELLEYMKRNGPLPDNPDPEPPSLFREKPRVAVYGDSTAVMVWIGLQTWFWKEDTGEPRPGIAELGCGLIEEGIYRTAGREFDRPNQCDTRAMWEATVVLGHPDVALVMVAPWDVADRKLPGDDVWRHPGDPVFDAHLRNKMLETVDLLSSEGALVMWMTHPRIVRRDWSGNIPETPLPSSEPARMERLNELIRELETLRPGKVRVIDFADYMRQRPGGELDETYRPDGVHLTASSSMRVANEWLGPEVLRIYREEAERARALDGDGSRTADAQAESPLDADSVTVQ